MIEQTPPSCLGRYQNHSRYNQIFRHTVAPPCLESERIIRINNCFTLCFSPS
jgi:hypothetical protein